MFLIILLVMLVMVLLIMLMPQMTGLATYAKNPDYIKKQQSKRNQKRENEFKPILQSHSYVPPDEQLNEDDIEMETKKNSGVGTGVYQKLKNAKITEEDIPIKLQLANESTLIQRARRNKIVNGQETSTDPNKYDYDLDELIEDELQEDHKEMMNGRVYKFTEEV